MAAWHWPCEWSVCPSNSSCQKRRHATCEEADWRSVLAPAQSVCNNVTPASHHHKQLTMHVINMNEHLSPVQTCNVLPCNLLPVWASCNVWATSCSKLNMFNIAQLVARCDFLLLKQATCCVDKLLILSRHATSCRQQVACLDGALQTCD